MSGGNFTNPKVEEGESPEVNLGSSIISGASSTTGSYGESGNIKFSPSAPLEVFGMTSSHPPLPPPQPPQQFVSSTQCSSSSVESSASNNSSPVHQVYHPGRGIQQEEFEIKGLDELLPAPGISNSAAAAIIASKQRMLQKENLRRVINPPKLERKHSSGDLHSRLKTRKILGVGETDNGDIHRSKISQVLGHNEHLYVKFPRGIWSWQAFLSALLLVQALLILFFPRQACQLKLLGIQQHQHGEKDGLGMGSKYYAVSLLALSFLLWRFMSIRDKAVARNVQLAALLHFGSLCAMDVFSAVTTDISQLFDATLLTVMGVRMGMVLICIMYLKNIGTATSGLRRSPSHKDIVQSMKKDG